MLVWLQIEGLNVCICGGTSSEIGTLLTEVFGEKRRVNFLCICLVYFERGLSVYVYVFVEVHRAKLVYQQKSSRAIT